MVPQSRYLIVRGLVPKRVARAAALSRDAHEAVPLDGVFDQVDVALESIELVIMHGTGSWRSEGAKALGGLSASRDGELQEDRPARVTF
jgi:hypothetical protein